MNLGFPQPIIAIIVPIIGAIIIRILDEEKANARHLVALISVGMVFIAVASMLPAVLSGQLIEYRMIDFLDGLGILFRIDLLGMVFAVVSSTLWVFATVYSIGYMAHEHEQRNYFVFFILSCSAAMGVAFAGNLFTLYIFYEYLAICTYPLVVHAGTKESVSAGIKYISYSLGGGALVFLSIFMIHDLVGTLDFMPGGILGGVADEKTTLLKIIFVLLIAGFGTKAALMPLHSWLPGAMVAPTPVSALLHAVAIVKAGVFGIARVFLSLYGRDLLIELNVTHLLAIVVCFTIIVGSFMAIKQTVLKLRLAYSTIGQLGYITLGVLILHPVSIIGGLIHIINHAVLKITLFFCAGMIITVTGKKNLNELNGVGRQMPLTMLAFAVGALGLMGVMPICGYISKYYILTGSLEAGVPVYAYVILGSTLLNAIYYLPIIVNAFFKEGNFEKQPGYEAPLTMLVPTLTLAVFAIIFGLFANYTTIPFIEAVIEAIL
ncbi:MAG: monovalent cation/H+ antiporter subunit D family protein [Bacillota bacterium]|nr:monovalent cation/H+ antiporter subunit D family protein [Bacillota bacterium]